MRIHKTAFRAVFVTAVGLGIVLGALPAGAASNTVVISEILTGDLSSAQNEFIELRNLTNTEYDISGWTIVYRKYGATTDTTNYLVPAESSIPPNGFYLAVSPTYYNSYIKGKANPMRFNGLTLANLAKEFACLALKDASGNIVDQFGYYDTADASKAGDLAYGEGNKYFVADAQFNKGSFTRIPINTTTGYNDGTQDTDDNLADFVFNPKPSPTSTISTVPPPTVTSVTFSPAVVNRGEGATLTAVITKGGRTVTGVTADLTAVGGGSSVVLTNASNGNWTTPVTVSPTSLAGNRVIQVTATDSLGVTGFSFGSIRVNGITPLTVTQARGQAPTNGNSSTLQVRGIVYAKNTGNAYMVEPDGGAGIEVADGGAKDGCPPLQPGDDVTVSGSLSYSGGEVVLSTETGQQADTIINSSGNPIPPATLLTIPTVTIDSPYQDRLVTLHNVVLNSAPITINYANAESTIAIRDADGNTANVYIYMNNTAIATSPYPGVPANPLGQYDGVGNVTFPTLVPGAIVDVTGALASAGGAAELKIRSGDDLPVHGLSLIGTTAASPAPVVQGNSVTFTVVTTQPGATVTADLTGISGSSSVVLTDGGANTFTTVAAIPADQAVGYVTVRFHAVVGDASEDAAVRFFVTNPVAAVTIAQARALPDGSNVSITGVTTASLVGPRKSYYVQDASGGVFVNTSGNDLALSEANATTIVGVKQTVNGQVVISYDTSTSIAGNPTSVPVPAVLTLSNWIGHPGELTRTASLTVLGSRPAGSERAFIVTDGTSTGEILFGARTLASATSGGDVSDTDLASFTVGSAFIITGIVDFDGRFNTWQIKPRHHADIALGAAVPIPGDVDGDGRITFKDAALALQVAAGILPGNDPSVSFARTDVFPKGVPDGQITLGDAVRILRAANQLDVIQ